MTPGRESPGQSEVRGRGRIRRKVRIRIGTRVWQNRLAVFCGSLNADGHRDLSDAFRQEGYAAGNAVHVESLHQLARLYAHPRDRTRAEVAHGHETVRKHSDSDRLVEHARRG